MNKLTVHLTKIIGGEDRDLPRAVSAAAASAAQSVAGTREKLCHTREGRPYFAAMPELCVSISHTGRYAAVSAEGFTHGIDIERLDRSFSPRIVQRFFSEGEKRWLAGAYDDKQTRERFFDVWTRKEAIIKAAERSLSQLAELDSFPSGCTDETVKLGSELWYMRTVTLPEQGLVLSACGSCPFHVEVSRLAL